ISAGVYGAWQSQSFPASSKTMVVTGVKPGARYQVRLRYITAKGVENPGSNTDLGEVTVGGVDAGAVAGRPSQQVVDDFDLDVLNLARQVLVQGTFRATTSELMDGARTDIDQLVAIQGQHQVFITDLRSVDAGTGIGHAVFAVRSDDSVVGVEYLTDGSIGEINFLANILGVTDPNGVGPPTKVLEYVAGKWRFKDTIYVQKLIANIVETQHLVIGGVITDRLADNAVSNRLRGADATFVSGTGFDVEEFSYTITLPEDADVELDGSANFLDGGGHGPSYHASSIKLFIDGAQINHNTQTGALAMQQLGTGGGASCPAGTYTVSMTCATKPDDGYDNLNFRIRWFFK
uniref:hypothetical protein n=1 Tax=Caulobacter sp. DWP3-1-3b2 TaxID=2804643 RepID=UPI003CE76398